MWRDSIKQLALFLAVVLLAAVMGCSQSQVPSQVEKHQSPQEQLEPEGLSPEVAVDETQTDKVEPTKSQEPQKVKLSYEFGGQKLLEDANERIELYRKGALTVHVVYDGKPVVDAQIKIQQKSHAFLFGANAFEINTFSNDADNEKYSKYFTDLFNYATLPFYWSSYEPVRGTTYDDRLKELVEWCNENNVIPKGHPLVWHQTVPGWLKDSDDIDKLTEDRISNIIRKYSGDIQLWDVVNEVTVASQADNPIGRWVSTKGEFDVVKMAVDTAVSSDPNAQLLVNEVNVFSGGAFLKLIDRLKNEKVPIHAIGIQSHMHGGLLSLDKAWQLCETYGRFGWPVDFTEVSVLSGKAKGKINWTSQVDNEWITGDEYEEQQAEYVKKFYTLLFSNPSVEAITWWDMRDGQWLNAPSGLIKKDLTPKKAYNELHKLIKEEWWTDTEGNTDEQGIFKTDAFYGGYDINVQVEGQSKTFHYNFEKKDQRAQEVTIEM